MNELASLQLPLEAIRAYCNQRPIKRLSLFGSALRDDLKPESDIDLLVEYAPEAKISYFDIVEQQTDFSEMIGRTVDLLTPQELSPYFRQEVMDHAEPLYDVEGIPTRRRRPVPEKPEKDRARLLHMLEAAEKARRIAGSYTRADIENNEMLELSLVKAVEIIGEAARHVSPETRALAPQIEWQKIVDMRNNLVHAYFRIKYDVLWQVITERLPALIIDLKRLILAKYGEQND